MCVCVGMCMCSGVCVCMCVCVCHLLVGILQSAIRTVMPSVSESSSSCMLTASAPSSSGSPKPFCWASCLGREVGLWGATGARSQSTFGVMGCKRCRGRIVRHLRSKTHVEESVDGRRLHARPLRPCGRPQDSLPCRYAATG